MRSPTDSRTSRRGDNSASVNVSHSPSCSSCSLVALNRWAKTRLTMRCGSIPGRRYPAAGGTGSTASV